MTRVLVVDDEIDTLNLLRTILEISGYEVITTLNSSDAITLADIERPDCILMDVMMPHLDGFTLCRMMRRYPSTAGLPIVFVTAHPAPDLQQRSADAGADIVLPKPVSMNRLIETIEQMILLKPKRPIGSNSTSNPGATASAPTTPPPADPPPSHPTPPLDSSAGRDSLPPLPTL